MTTASNTNTPPAKMHDRKFIEDSLGAPIGGRYDDVAFECAKDAGETCFYSGRGYFEVTLDNGNKLLCLYNNSPYSGDDSRRDRETVALCEGIEEIGAEIVGYQAHPPESNEYAGGHTYAMLVSGTDDQLDRILGEALHSNLEKREWLIALVDGQTPRVINSEGLIIGFPGSEFDQGVES